MYHSESPDTKEKRREDKKYFPRTQFFCLDVNYSDCSNAGNLKRHVKLVHRMQQV